MASGKYIYVIKHLRQANGDVDNIFYTDSIRKVISHIEQRYPDWSGQTKLKSEIRKSNKSYASGKASVSLIMVERNEKI